MDYASNSKGNTGVALGAVGTGLSILSSIGSMVNAHANMGEETAVTRHELNYVQEIANKDHTIAKLEGQQYTDAAIKGLSDQLAVKFNRVQEQFDGVNAAMNGQMLINTQQTATMQCMQNQLNVLMGMTKVIIPNANVMPGWGDVTITPAGAATVKGAVPSSNG